jgi:hypothetical protein
MGVFSSMNYSRGTFGTPAAGTDVSTLYACNYSTIDADTVGGDVTYNTLKALTLSTFNYGNNGFVDLSSKITDINSAITIGASTSPMFYKKSGIYYLSFYCVLANNANFTQGEIILRVSQTFNRFPATNYSTLMNQSSGAKVADLYWYMDMGGSLKARPAYTVPSSGTFELNVQISWPEEFVNSGGV